MPVDRLILGSRRSRLAVRQTEWVGARLRARWPELAVELRAFATEGDRSDVQPLPEIGGKGLFTADLEAALRAGEIDLAVHSLKDLPTAADERAEVALEVLAIPEREDPSDVLVTDPRDPRRLEDLPAGARVGTSSTRRAGQLRHLRPDLNAVPIRGNVETRIGRIGDEVDAVILAAAGLSRLGLEGPEISPLDPERWLPAPGQGALAVQGRADDGHARALVLAIESPDARAETTAERALLARLEAGCHAPVAALARAEEHGGMVLDASVYDPGGRSPPLRGCERGSRGEARDLGERLAERLLAEGAAEFVRGATPGGAA